MLCAKVTQKNQFRVRWLEKEKDERSGSLFGLGLDEAAVEALQQWRFRPGLIDGVPVSVQAIIEVNFGVAR